MALACGRSSRTATAELAITATSLDVSSGTSSPPFTTAEAKEMFERAGKIPYKPMGAA